MIQSRMGFNVADQTESRPDTGFERIFWPQGDLGKWDGLGRYGFWVCLASGAYTGYVEIANQETGLACASLFAYWIAACGVREHSTLAAGLTTVWLMTGQIGNRLMGLPLVPVDVIATILLLVSTYWTFLGSKSPQDPATGQPVGRKNQNLLQKLVDQLPAKVWKAVRTPFLVICGGIVLLCVYSTILAMRQGSPTGYTIESVEKVRPTSAR